jgi:hypothetical protein
LIILGFVRGSESRILRKNVVIRNDIV